MTSENVRNHAYTEKRSAFRARLEAVQEELTQLADLDRRVRSVEQMKDYRRQIVESGNTQQALSTPNHEYTQRLLASMPRMPHTSAWAKSRSAPI